MVTGVPAIVANIKAVYCSDENHFTLLMNVHDVGMRPVYVWDETSVCLGMRPVYAWE